MKKILTLVAAAFMAVNVSAANKVLKITGTADKANPWDIQCFINLKNLEKGKAYDVKFDVYTTAGTEFKIGTEAIDETQTEHMTEWNASAVFSNTEELTLTNTKLEAVIHFPGKTTVTCHTHCTAKPGMEINHDGGNIKTCDPEILENFEYAASALLLNIGKLPKDAVIYIGSIKVYDADGNLLSTENFDDATVGEYDTNKTIHYPGWQNAATFEIADENATYIPSLELADIDFSASDANKIGGWGGSFHSEINKTDGVDVITFTPQQEPHNVQVDFENVYPKGAKIRLTMVAKGTGSGSINAVLQNPDNYKACSNYEDITLATDDFQSIEKTFICSGDNARRLLLNVGTYEGTIYIKKVKIEALEVLQETVTISPSGYSTYAAYYPVNYAKLGLTAYAVKLNAKEKTITLEEIKDVVPAGVPVLLKGDAKEYALEKAEGGSPVSTDLKMSDGNATSTAAATLYALATVNDLTAFYPVKKDSSIPAKRCYLEVNGTSQKAAFYSLGTNFGETTGISSVENKVEKADAPVYNLAGQLVGKDYKGLVIKNGKKFVIK